MDLWKKAPGDYDKKPEIIPFIPEKKLSDAAIIICPGGGYGGLADHEGSAYAEFFAGNGITSFVLNYRVAPYRFPLPLNDSRRAIRFVRAHADEYGIDTQKIAIMGSSAGGHLSALTSTYKGLLPNEDLDETDKQDSIPNAQILCYPVIISPDEGGISHVGSYENLLGGKDREKEHAVDPSL